MMTETTRRLLEAYGNAIHEYVGERMPEYKQRVREARAALEQEMERDTLAQTQGEVWLT